VTQWATLISISVALRQLTLRYHGYGASALRDVSAYFPADRLVSNYSSWRQSYMCVGANDLLNIARYPATTRTTALTPVTE